jgi:SAM-dependent methyltransferase
MSGDLEFTGERFIPGAQGPIWIEHWHRYHFAAPWAHGKRVLDIACGEGYGSALLARHARAVTGVDVSPAAVEHARNAYAGVPRLEFLQGSCAAIPLPDASIDFAVSFETIEHIHEQSEFLAELARVLAPDGVLLLSSPDKAEYGDRRAYANEYHVRELYRDELAALVQARFPHVRWFAQKPTFFSVIAPEGPAAAGTLASVAEADPSMAESSLAAPLYHLVAASRDAASLETFPATLHVLADRDDWVWRDYEKVMKWMEQAVADRDRLQRELAARDAELAASRAQVQPAQPHADGKAAEAQIRERPAETREHAHPAESPRLRGLRAWLAGLLR